MSSASVDNDLEALIQELGDVCHVHYLGCSQNTEAPDGFEYAYDNEVINLLDTPEARKALEKYTAALKQELKQSLEALADDKHNGFGKVVTLEDIFAVFQDKGDNRE